MEEAIFCLKHDRMSAVNRKNYLIASKFIELIYGDCFGRV